jgi:hypothetical protein
MGNERNLLKNIESLLKEKNSEVGFRKKQIIYSPLKDFSHHRISGLLHEVFLYIYPKKELTSINKADIYYKELFGELDIDLPKFFSFFGWRYIRDEAQDTGWEEDGNTPNAKVGLIGFGRKSLRLGEKIGKLKRKVTIRQDFLLEKDKVEDIFKKDKYVKEEIYNGLCPWERDRITLIKDLSRKIVIHTYLGKKHFLAESSMPEEEKREYNWGIPFELIKSKKFLSKKGFENFKNITLEYLEEFNTHRFRSLPTSCGCSDGFWEVSGPGLLYWTKKEFYEDMGPHNRRYSIF